MYATLVPWLSLYNNHDVAIHMNYVRRYVHVYAHPVAVARTVVVRLVMWLFEIPLKVYHSIMDTLHIFWHSI